MTERKIHAKWTGKWAGGRIQEGPRGRVFWIEKKIENVRYNVRLAGVRTEPQAVDELKLFRANPAGYLPPRERAELAELEVEEEEIERIEREREATRLVMTDALLDAFAEAQAKGYGSRAPASKHHAFVCRSFLKAWQTHPAIEGRDIRTVALREWRDALETGMSLVPVAGGKPPALRPWASFKARIVALRSYTAWLRWRGDLARNEDTTLDLSVPQARHPTPTEKAERAHTIEELEKTYAAISSQTVRDLFWLRVHTGLHESEVERIASGECVIYRQPKGSRIAAVVEVLHKSGKHHRQSVDEASLARVERLMARKWRGKKGAWIGEKTLARHRAAAAKASGCREVFIGHLRHTRTTLLEQVGEEVRQEGLVGGVPIERVARSHGHSPATAATHYSAVSVPPMLCVPVKLQHPSDP